MKTRAIFGFGCKSLFKILCLCLLWNIREKRKGDKRPRVIRHFFQPRILSVSVKRHSKSVFLETLQDTKSHIVKEQIPTISECYPVLNFNLKTLMILRVIFVKVSGCYDGFEAGPSVAT
ncbi:hypothetical protein BY458DRAFT_488969 [Sporodiniella umbellata]|nr:hypothetical protein BY458DRAFT_488969 [Sporodiniella umbellata]